MCGDGISVAVLAASLSAYPACVQSQQMEIKHMEEFIYIYYHEKKSSAQDKKIKQERRPPPLLFMSVVSCAPGDHEPVHGLDLEA